MVFIHELWSIKTNERGFASEFYDTKQRVNKKVQIPFHGVFCLYCTIGFVSTHKIIRERTVQTVFGKKQRHGLARSKSRQQGRKLKSTSHNKMHAEEKEKPIGVAVWFICETGTEILRNYGNK